jgi:hypothetical protein
MGIWGIWRICEIWDYLENIKNIQIAYREIKYMHMGLESHLLMICVMSVRKGGTYEI